MLLRPVILTVLVLASVAYVGPAGAQTVSDHVAQGDSLYAAKDAAGAFKHYEAALAVDSTSYEALWKASREAVDLGEATEDKAERTRLYGLGERYARRAVAANPADAEGHFHLSRALGRRALSVGTRERIKYAGEVREHALKALEYNPQHPGALHVMGVWNAEIMRLNGVSRFMAKNFLGGKVFGTASWKDAVRYMEQAVAVEPNRLIHRVDLAEIYADVGDKAKARTELEYVMNTPPAEPNDEKYKRQAEKLLRELQ